MLYCEIMGGFGNLLFQFCTTYSFARQIGVEFSFPNLDKQISYLNEEVRFNPTMKHAEEYKSILAKFPYNRNAIFTSGTRVEYPFQYIDFLPKDNDIICGYFQSEKYFNKYKNEILSILTPDNELESNITNALLRLPTKYNAVHVRLGDYVKTPNFHTNLPIEYFMKAIEEVRKESDLPWVVFSDSIEICKNYFNGSQYIFSENTRDYIEMYLIAKAENTVISNSSFSWWGAWIGEGKGITKTIIAPSNDKWFGRDLNYLNTQDIIPNRWRMIKYD
jgi:hypothetical protein